MPPRILIFTASIGEGHDLPARTLSDQLREERPGVEVVTVDALAAMGRAVSAVSEDAARVVFHRIRWMWDVGFWLFTGPAPTRELSQRMITRLGGAGVLRAVEANDPAVVVSVYPNVTEVLARLRRGGRIRVPVVAAITDLAAMRYWASPGADVHLVTHPESIAEVRSIVGDRAPVHCVHGFTAPAFRAPRMPTDARATLALPEAGKVVLVSGGGWGVGDVEGAAEVALTVADVSCVACLCGRNEQLRARVTDRLAGEARVRVEGFTDVMSDWLAACDVLIHSTGGLTVLEALMRGCPAISYGWGRGHVRVNNEAFRRFGLARVAADRAGLRNAIVAALAEGRHSPRAFEELPSAASFVLAAADAG